NDILNVTQNYERSRRKSWSVHFIILGADALLFCPSSPCKVESVEFVSNLKRLRALFLFWVMANTQNLSHTDLPNNTSCYRLS
ncbi:hypothetical protein, partial [Yersinia enterocolitica]|uniref:hypothetical protein n=1 Tax=Yersinia enterocolitica TaxID=630 RepID=UPI001C902B61